MRTIVLTGTAIIFAFIGHSNAETLKLSQLTKEDRVAIQRGYSIPEAACVFEIIDEIDVYGGPEAMEEFRISFENGPLKISNGRLTHLCDGGVHVRVENGQRRIAQKYNEDGLPTLMEH